MSKKKFEEEIAKITKQVKEDPGCEICGKKVEMLVCDECENEGLESAREQEDRELAERVKDHQKGCDCFICVHV